MVIIRWIRIIKLDVFIDLVQTYLSQKELIIFLDICCPFLLLNLILLDLYVSKLNLQPLNFLFLRRLLYFIFNNNLLYMIDEFILWVLKKKELLLSLFFEDVEILRPFSALNSLWEYNCHIEKHYRNDCSYEEITKVVLNHQVWHEWA